MKLFHMLITFNVLKAFTEKVEFLSTHQGKGDAVDAAVAWGHPSINLVAVPIHPLTYLTCKFKVNFRISGEEHEGASLTDI